MHILFNTTSIFKITLIYIRTITKGICSGFQTTPQIIINCKFHFFYALQQIDLTSDAI